MEEQKKYSGVIKSARFIKRSKDDRGELFIFGYEFDKVKGEIRSRHRKQIPFDIGRKVVITPYFKGRGGEMFFGMADPFYSRNEVVIDLEEEYDRKVSLAEIAKKKAEVVKVVEDVTVSLEVYDGLVEMKKECLRLQNINRTRERYKKLSNEKVEEVIKRKVRNRNTAFVSRMREAGKLEVDETKFRALELALRSKEMEEADVKDVMNRAKVYYNWIVKVKD